VKNKPLFSFFVIKQHDEYSRCNQSNDGTNRYQSWSRTAHESVFLARIAFCNNRVFKNQLVLELPWYFYHNKAMRDELSKLVQKVQDPTEQKKFQLEMANFHELFTRYLNEKAKKQKLY
jgi:hypothetical protein